MHDYTTFLNRKLQLTNDSGFKPLWIPDFLFDFQKYLVEWAISKGKAAIFADCGLGKGPMQLVFAENVIRHAGGKFLIIAPLAVAQQFVREGAKFGIDVTLSRDGTAHRLTVANYESLHKFNPADFIGASADESSAIKAFDGRRRKQVVRFFSKLPYRLLCTATPSPNDFIELGTQSECLGVMTQSDMLGYFFRETKDMRHSVFRDDDIHNRIKWWFKPHSEQPFWRWVSSWARAVRKPSDIGFKDDGFVLPELKYEHHVLDIPFIPPGELFHRPAITINEQRYERQRTVKERCEKTAELLNVSEPAIAWVHYNEEGDTLERMMPWAVQIAGKHSDDYKEAAVEWFAGYRCLCSDKMFSHKLSAWQKQNDLPDGGLSSTKNTATSCLQSNGINGHLIPNGVKEKTPTLASTTAHINGCGSAQGSNRIGSTRANESGTLTTQASGSVKSRKSGSIARNTLTPASIDFCEGAEKHAPMSKSLKSRKASARFAATVNQETGEGTSCTSIIATNPAELEGCCAPTATSRSENLATIQSDLSVPQCICGHQSGKRILITKSKITGFGVNWQCAGLMTFFPTFSFEQFYQGVRRCWRFGRKDPVTVHIVSAEGESRVMDGLTLKQEQSEKMFSSLTRHMNDALAMMSEDGHDKAVLLPSWLKSEVA